MISENVILCFLTLSCNCLLLGANENVKPQEKLEVSKPIHVAIITGCDSHFSYTAQLASSLISWPSVPNKYRVTYVTSANCKERVESLGATLHDTGVWTYPITDPDVGIFERLSNLSMGVLTHTISGLESLVKKDRPDIVITEPYGAVAGTVAERYDIPFVTVAAICVPPPRACRDGLKVPAPLTRSIILHESNPTWLLTAACTLFYHVGTVVSEIMIYEAHFKLNEIRRRYNQEPMDNLIHMFSYYPLLSLLGKPLSPDIYDNDTVYHIGILPEKVTPDESDLAKEVQHFIDTSDRPLIFISLGTYYAFSDDYVGTTLKVLEEQSRYNVLWSNKRWTTEVEKTVNQERFFMRPKLPQRKILESGKIKIFISHCGVSSLVESIRAAVPVIGVPQGRDQFVLAQKLQSAKIGIELTSEPDTEDLLQAMRTIETHWNFYQQNLKISLHQLTNNSVENLERVIDAFVERGHVVTFKSGSLFPTYQAFLLIAVVLSTVITVSVLVSLGLLRLCCFKRTRMKKGKSD